MNIKELENYLDNTPKNEIKELWDKRVKKDNVGVSIDNLLKLLNRDIEQFPE